MNRRRLLSSVLRGETVLVGELRAARPELSKVFDNPSGEAIRSASIIFLVERTLIDIAERVTIYQRYSDYDAACEASKCFEKGKLYAFFLQALQFRRGFTSGWIGTRDPQLIGRHPKKKATVASLGRSLILYNYKHLHTPAIQ